jgi:hypothetical protein
MLLPQKLTTWRIMAGNLVDLLESEFLEKSGAEGAGIILMLR